MYTARSNASLSMSLHKWLDGREGTISSDWRGHKSHDTTCLNGASKVMQGLRSREK